MEDTAGSLHDRLVGLLELIFYHGRQSDQEALHQLASTAAADEIDADLALLIEAARLYWQRENEECLHLVTTWLGNERSAGSPLRMLATAIRFRCTSRLYRNEDALSIIEQAELDALPRTPQEVMVLAWMKGAALSAIKQYHASAKVLDKAHATAIRCGFGTTSAIIDLDRAVAASEMGDKHSAIVMYEGALRELTVTDAFRPLVLVAKFNVATVYQSVGRDADALRMYAEVIDASTSWGIPGYYTTARLNMAIALKRLGSLDEAGVAYREVLEQAGVDANHALLFHAHIGLSDLCLLQNDAASASSNATRALEIAQAMNIPSMQQEAMTFLASIDAHVGDLDTAIERLSTAYDGALSQDDAGRAARYGETLATYYAAAGRFADAFDVKRSCAEQQDKLHARAIERTADVTAMRQQLISERASVLQMDAERERLLQSVMPRNIADRIMAGEATIADAIPDATIMFADIVGFTEMASTMEPEALLVMLEELFGAFDEICARHGCERVKTIGDSYMAICGATTAYADHALRMCRAALAILDAHGTGERDGIRLRIGVHSGPVVAGVMRGARLSYDVWGDTVAIASTLESLSEPGRIHCSQTVADAITASGDVQLEARAPLPVAGKERLQTYWLFGR